MPGGIKNLSWVAETGTILKKELRSELRRRWSSALLLLFGLVTVFVVSFSLGAGSLTPGILSAFRFLVSTLVAAKQSGASPPGGFRPASAITRPNVHRRLGQGNLLTGRYDFYFNFGRQAEEKLLGLKP